MWICCGSAVPGFGHERDNALSCQDVVYCLNESNFRCICLSDGAGSAKYAREGALLTVKSVSELLKRHFYSLYNQRDKSIVSKRVVECVIKTILNECSKSDDNRTLQDYYSTLLVVAIKDDKCIALHVGDGIIGSRLENKLSIVSHPWNGEFKNETVFVTSPMAIETMDIVRFRIPAGNVSFFIMSDGTSTSFYSEVKKELISQQGLHKLCDFSMTMQYKELQEVLRYNLFESISHNTSDDCSLCIMSRRSKS